MKKIGFIDFYLDEWHANNYPAWIREASNGEMEVAYAYGMIDSPRGGLTSAAWCEQNGIERCMSVEEITEKSDCLIVLSPDNCEMHEGLCQIPLRSGKPVYVDKTFAPDYATAARIFAVAEQSGTPCYSTSALRFAKEYADIDPAKVKAISTFGPDDPDTYSIHQLEPILMLMKAPVQQVLFTGDDSWYTVLLRFADGRHGSLSGFMGGSPFITNIQMEGGPRCLTVASDFFHEFIVQLVEFFRTAEVKVPHEETLRIMAVRGAMLLAQKTPGVWVNVNGGTAAQSK